MLTLYGIQTCDTVRKARKWLDAHGVEYRFHDFRVDGLDPALLQRWLDQAGWETLLNRRGATWRALPEGVRAGLDGTRVKGLLLERPTLIKRPVLDDGRAVHVGFDPRDYERRFG